MTSAMPVQCCTNWAIKPTGSWSCSEFWVLHGYTMNSEHDQLPVGLIAQLVEHCTGITEVMCSNPVQAGIDFFFLFISFQIQQAEFWVLHGYTMNSEHDQLPVGLSTALASQRSCVQIHGYTMNSEHDQLPPSWLDSSVGRALHWHHRGHVFKSCSSLNFFQVFRNSLVAYITARTFSSNWY